jgi:hypothetical protein
VRQSQEVGLDRPPAAPLEEAREGEPRFLSEREEDLDRAEELAQIGRDTLQPGARSRRRGTARPASTRRCDGRGRSSDDRPLVPRGWARSAADAAGQEPADPPEGEGGGGGIPVVGRLDDDQEEGTARFRLHGGRPCDLFLPLPSTRKGPWPR